MAARKPIKIKKSKQGSFTAYCKRKKLPMSKCAAQAKKSKSKAIRKKAVFAQNSAKWNH